MKILKFRRAKEGDAVGRGVLTAEGARQLNQCRTRVARGEKPSASELLERVILKTEKDVGDVNKTMLVARLRGEDAEIYPGRVPWTFREKREG